MMKRLFLLLALAACLSAGECSAQVPQTGVGVQIVPQGQGPGDVVPAATAWWGLRAYSSAYAAGGGLIGQFQRNSDNQKCDFASAVDGTFGLSVTTASGCSSGQTYAQWALDATCTGTIAGTTLSCTGASGTPHVGSMLSGTGLSTAGVAASWQIVSCGAFVAGTGTCTVGAGTPAVGTPETITMAWPSLINLLYDQTGGGNTISNGSNNFKPVLFFPCFGSRPCVFFNGQANRPNLTALNGITIAQPYTISLVADRQTSTAATQALFGTFTGATILLGFSSSANLATQYAGTLQTGAANDNATHAIQGVYNGASSVLNIDGTGATTNPGAAGWSNLTPEIGTNASAQYFRGPAAEFGIWSGAFSTAQQTAMCHNQYTFWTTATSC